MFLEPSCLVLNYVIEYNLIIEKFCKNRDTVLFCKEGRNTYMAADRQIVSGIYWVGEDNPVDNLHCNPYLIVDGDEAVLIDPGSVLDFEQVYQNILNIIPIEKIKYVILDHQDPDFCASVPLFEKNGGNFKIVTHWRTQMLVKYYGIKSDYYIINEHDNKLVLKSGRILQFIPAPYLHFAGTITTYDTKSKVLFSGDLFGAISDTWTLYAKDDYIEKMKAFHEHYMASNDILGPVMQGFLSMDISMIAPQHGSVIAHDVIKYIRALRDLDCGSFLTPIKRDLIESGGYLYICSIILKRYSALFGKTEVLNAVKDLDIKIERNTLDMLDYNYTGSVLWDTLFDEIYEKKGAKWILLIEPLVLKICGQFDIDIPSIIKTITKNKTVCANKNYRTIDANSHPERMLTEAREKLTKDPATQLYNYGFFKEYLSEGIKENILNFNPVLIVLKIDNIEKVRFSYGEEECNRLLINTANIIKTIKKENAVIFRLQGTEIACYLLDSTKQEATELAEKIRNAVALSNAFIEKTTVSIGLASLDEIQDRCMDKRFLFEEINEVALYRLHLAETSGKNIVCSDSEILGFRDKHGKVLVVDTDNVHVDVVKTLLENIGIRVLTADNGEEALKIAGREVPDVIVTELMLPKMDAFRLKECLMMRSRTKYIDLLIVSHLKSEDMIERALSLGIEHYLKKPVMLPELIGIVKLKIKGEAGV